MWPIRVRLALEKFWHQLRHRIDGGDNPAGTSKCGSDTRSHIATADEEEPWPLSEYERELLQRSLDSLDYLGDWANPNNAKDSIVLTCNKPDVHVASNGIEEFDQKLTNREV